MTAVRRTADRVLSEAGQRRPLSSVSLDDLAELARDYLRLAGPDANGPRATLGSWREAIYVTAAAAREYAAVERIRDEDAARRELTEMLLDARQNPTDPSLWRVRSRSVGLDVSARVVIEGRLAVVTTASARDDNRDGRRRDR